MHRCRTLAALAVGGALALTGCGGGSGNAGTPKTSPSSGQSSGGTTTAAPDAATQYQAVVRTAEQATCTFNKAVARLGPKPQVRETKDLVPPVTGALRRFRRELGNIRWPTAAKSDADNLQKATDAVITDIEALPDQTPTSMTTWTAKTTKDKATFAAVTRSLRAHIGLLPLAADTCA